MTEHYSEVNGVRLHYWRAGTGPLILFLHGFPEFWYAWRKQVEAFSVDHSSVAPDLRGYNLSSKPEPVEQYAVEHLVEDVRALAEELDPKEFVLVGHDWGGLVAWCFAMRYPERLAKLVIINAPHPGIFPKLLRENPEQQKASAYIDVFRNAGVEDWLAANHFALLRRALAGTGLKDGVFTEEDWRAYEEAWSQPGALTGALNYYRALRPSSNEPEDFRVHVPTLVLWGEQDPALTIHNLEGLETYVPALTVKRFPEASHWLVHEQPAAVNQAIRDFLDAH